jgi:oligosaccharide repeat unit polymerase
VKLTLHDFGPLALPASAGPRRAADLWWLQPSLIVLLAILPIYLGILTYDFSGVVKNIYVPSRLYVFGIVLIAALAVGAQWALAHRVQQPALVPPRISSAVMMGLLLPTLAAYAIWFGPLLGNPQLLMEIALGQRSEVRNSISTIPGVTTFTQLGVAYAIAYAIKAGGGVQQVSRFERAGLMLVLLLATFRAYAWAERLAVIEILVCFAIARMAYLPLPNATVRRAASIAPAIAPFVLYLLFTASEYFRSWEFYANQYSSVWAFTLDRLITYYATAVNNGIGILVESTDWPYYNGAFVVDWLYIMPGVSKLFESTFGNPRELTGIFLETYLRPEFNSPTAYFRIVLDFGYLGSVLYCLTIGYLIGRAYIGFRRGHIFGLLTYPVCVLFLIESLRYSYLGETRIVPLGVGLAIIALDMRRLRRR